MCTTPRTAGSKAARSSEAEAAPAILKEKPTVQPFDGITIGENWKERKGPAAHHALCSALTSVPSLVKLVCGFLVVLTIFLVFIFSYRGVPYLHIGLLRSSFSGALVRGAEQYEAGRHFVGPDATLAILKQI